MRQEPGDVRGAVRQCGELSRRAVSAGDGPVDALSGRIVAAARQAVGARFRRHGRDPATGLDCVGLVAWALRGSGFKGDVPGGYALRGGTAAQVSAAIDGCGLVPVGAARAGDVLLCRSGPGQWHLAIASDGGVIHADAMLRRVVERPGAPPWPVAGCWKLADDIQAGSALAGRPLHRPADGPPPRDELGEE